MVPAFPCPSPCASSLVAGPDGRVAQLSRRTVRVSSADVGLASGGQQIAGGAGVAAVGVGSTVEQGSVALACGHVAGLPRLTMGRGRAQSRKTTHQ